jgi:hypothetical protein
MNTNQLKIKIDKNTKIRGNNDNESVIGSDEGRNI